MFARMIRVILQMLIQGDLVFTLEFDRPIWIDQSNNLRYIYELLSNDFDKFFLIFFTDCCTRNSCNLLLAADRLVTFPVSFLAIY